MYDEEIEKAILFYLIFGGENCVLTEDDFVIPMHKSIITAINKLRGIKAEISILTVNNEVADTTGQSLTYLAGLGDYISRTSFETAYKLLKDYTKQRQVFNLTKDVQMQVRTTENIDVFIEKQISELQKIESQTETDISFAQQVSNALSDIERNLSTKGDVSLHTGFYDLDDLTDGLHNGELTVIGARPRSW